MPTNEAAERGEILRYVKKAFVAHVLNMNVVRESKKLDLSRSLAAHGVSRNSSSWMIGQRDIEEECIAALLHQKADLYLDAYGRKGLRIGPEVLKDIASTMTEIVAGRKSAMIGEANLLSARTHHSQSSQISLGAKAGIAMREIEAKIDLYNLTPKKADPMNVVNNYITYHLQNSRVVHGDDNSVNIVNEKELFNALTSAISTTIEDIGKRDQLLAQLDDLKNEKNRGDYLTKLTRFLAAASAITHFLAPYLPALVEKGESLVR